MATQKRTIFKNVTVNSSSLVYLVYLLYFLFVLGLILWFLSFTVKKAMQIAESTQEEFTITARKIYLPTDEDLEKLNEIYKKISTSFADLENLDVEIRRLYDEVETAKVSSIAYQHFNSLKNCFCEYQEQLSAVKEHVPLYEEMYNEYIDYINNIPKFSHIYYEQYNKFIENIEFTYDVVYEKNQECIANEEELSVLFLNAQSIADTLFDEEYEPLCRLVQVESGNCPAEEQWYTVAVLENRIMHPEYPDNIYDVIHSPGQYSTVASGAFDRAIPSDEVKKNVEDFLRGRVELDIPLNVVYQSRSILGDGIWKAMDSGQYFCYKNFD